MKLPYNISTPIVVVCGHFGSGKTNVSVALALALSRSGKKVTLVDLDIVNPYFRAADAEDLMNQNGIRCINPQYANTNVDVPSLGSEIKSIFVEATDPDHVTVIDVGGDNGAAALGQYRAQLEQVGYDMLFVVNKYRPLTETPELAVEDLREIEYYARLRCTHIVNNSNIGSETTMEYVENSFDYSDEICRISGLNEAFVSVVNAPFCSELTKKHPSKNFFFIENTTRKIF